MTSQPIMPRYSFEEYLAIERVSQMRNEYVDGYVRSMAGGTGVHNAITGNLFAELRAPALAEGCQTYVADRRLDVEQAGRTSRAYYPDVMVVCAPRIEDYSEVAPCFVAEVLSESTAPIDQIEKLAAYMAIPSVLAYAVVSQAERRVVLHRRHGDEFRAEVLGPNDELRLDCPPATLAVADLYVGVTR